jgi:membrane-associated phospholipid phosphatase
MPARRVTSFMQSKLLETSAKRLIGLDDRAKRLFAPYADTVPMRALDLLSKLGDQPELRMIAGGLLVVGTFASNDRLVRAGARILVAHEAATVVKDVVKINIDRTRPRSADRGRAKRPKKGNHTAKEKTSFPSGHSAGAIAAARAFSREFPEYGAIAIGGAALIAASQVPRCAHYPTDVAAGVFIGLVIEGVTSAAWDAAEMDERSAG